MSPADLSVMGLILEAHYAVLGHKSIFAVAINHQLRRYAYLAPSFATPLPPLPPSPPATWSADQLGGSGSSQVDLTVTFPDPSSPLSLTLAHSASSAFYGEPAPQTGSGVTLTGRVLGTVYETPLPPPLPPSPPVAITHSVDPSFPAGFEWPIGFTWPGEETEQEFLPWYYVMYYEIPFPILRDLPLVSPL